MYDLDKKIIFTHPPKCGGTSIEDMLGFLELRNRYPSVHAFKHGSLKMHVDTIKSKGFNPDDFFKFSIIRNPWGRAVSFYNHNKYKAYEYHLNNVEHPMPMHVMESRQMTFKQFVFKYYKNHFNSQVETIPHMFLNNKFSIDYVIRLENLKEDVLFLKDRLQINSNINIPHLNNSEMYVERVDYKNYYDEETKNFIANLFEWDIKKFNYSY